MYRYLISERCRFFNRQCDFVVIHKVGPCLTAFNLDFYTDVQDLSYLQEYLDNDPRSAKYR